MNSDSSTRKPKAWKTSPELFGRSVKRRREDFLGKHFGHWTVTEIIETEGSARPLCRCVCACGAEVDIRPEHLLSGKRNQCKHCWKPKKGPDLTGQRFGQWTALARKPYHKREWGWLCECQCGYTRTVRPKQNEERSRRSQIR